MPLSYSPFQTPYDEVDLIHGMFLPARGTNRPDRDKVRIFINIYGTFADLMGRFAFRYDNLVIPSKGDACVFDPEYIKNTLPQVGVDAIMEEDGFWEYVDAYPWYLLLMGELYKLCGGDYYLLLPMYDSKQLEHRLTWVWRHFGDNAKDHTILLTRSAASNLLVHDRNDLYIGSDLVDCEAWCDAGGSSFWWPTIDGKCKNPSTLLSKRIKLLSQVVADLHDLSKK